MASGVVPVTEVTAACVARCPMMYVRLCCFMWSGLQQHSKAMRLPANWPAPWGSVSKTQSITLFVCSGVAVEPDTTNHSPNVPTPHNSPVWNSTNSFSAAVVSTACPHSWANHRPQIRPSWLLACMPVITPQNMLIPQDSSPNGFMDTLLYLRAPKGACFVKSPSLREQRQRTLRVFSWACCQVSNAELKLSKST